jgi:hypothetical protein
MASIDRRISILGQMEEKSRPYLKNNQKNQKRR